MVNNSNYSKVKKKQRQGLLGTAACAALLSVTATVATGTEVRSSEATARSEGILPNAPSTYARITGANDGLELDLTLPNDATEFDYSLMFWFRSHKSLAELEIDESLIDSKAFLFQLPGSTACYVTRYADDEAGSPLLECTAGESEDSIKVKMEDLPDVQSWMHLTYSAKFETEEPYAQLSLDGLTLTGEYAKMRDRNVYYGCGLDDGTGYGTGFPGDYREFFYSLGFVEEGDQVRFLEHQQKVLEYETRGHYTFQENSYRDRLDDAFRPQSGRPIGEMPDFIDEVDVATPLCESIFQKQDLLPAFKKSSNGKFQNLEIPKFQSVETDFSYTVSIWLKNFGKQSYSSSPLVGRKEHHLLHIKESFAIWFDSPYSIRVYVYAKANYEESFSESVTVPLREWVNIQLTVDFARGIRIMTFNQNGDKIQEVKKEIYLGEQYSENKLSLFESFTGVVQSVQVWQKSYELPLDLSKSYGNRIINYKFSKENYKSKGWGSPKLTASTGKDFEFVYEKAPGSDVNFRKPTRFGQLDADSTQWNGVSCPNPRLSQAYFRGKGAGFSMDVLVEKTESYSVEFWFRPDVSKAAELASQGVTDLFTMADFKFNVMTVYVEDGQLKCSPFGRNKGFDMVYEGVGNPLEIDMWQHISCASSNKKFVKGQYLAVNLDPTGAPIEGLAKTLMQPKTFALSIIDALIENENVLYDNTWKVVVGNDSNFEKSIYGSFKDVRLWKSMRHDNDLYSYRFRQVQRQPNLMANFKLLDGSPYILNAAASTPQTFENAVLPEGMKLIEADGESLVCAPDTFFDNELQACRRYPFTDAVSIVNNRQGDSLALNLVAKSFLFLPDRQPRIDLRWSLSDKAIPASESADPSSVTISDYSNGLAEQVGLTVTDPVNHSFSLQKEQEVIPLQCYQLVDTAMGQTRSSIMKMVGAEVTEDLCFDFEAKTLCPEKGISLRDDIEISSQPPLKADVLDTFTTKKLSGSKFQVCIPPSTIEGNSMPKNFPVSLIFTASWNMGQGRVASMGVVFDLTLVAEILPHFKFLRNVRDVGSDDSLHLDARDSHYVAYNQGSSLGMTYRWECDGNFQEYCDLWEGSPILQIPNSVVQLYGALNTYYTFSVVVTSLGAESVDSPVAFKLGDAFIWSNESTPEFKIIVPDGLVHVTQTERLTIEPENFRFSDPGYTYQFELTPKDEYENSLVAQSAGNTILTIQPFTLKFDTDYKVSVKVFNTNSDNIAPGEEVLVFRTMKEPKISDFTISSTIGVMFETDFTMTIEGVSSTPEATQKYLLFGFTDVYPNVRFQLMPTYLDLGLQGKTTLTMKLPEIEAIELQLLDSNGEIALSKLEVNVDRNLSLSWLETIKSFDSALQNDDVARWEVFTATAIESQVFTKEGLGSTQLAIDTNQFIVEAAAQTVSGIATSSTSAEDLALIRLIVLSLKRISEYPDYMSDEVRSNIIQVLYDINERTALEIALLDQLFIENMVTVIGNLLDVGSINNGSQSESVSRRQLQSTSSTEIKQLILLQDTLSDLKCQVIDTDASQVIFRSNNLEMLLQKVPADYSELESQFANFDGTVQLDIPIDQLLLQSKQENPDFEWLCVRALIIKSNPVPPASDQFFLADSYSTQISTLDSLGHRHSSSEAGGFDGLETTPFNLFFDFDFSNTDFYIEGKTLCFQNSGDGKRWSDEGCSTLYYFSETAPKIRCSCDTLHDYFYAIITDKSIDNSCIGKNCDKEKPDIKNVDVRRAVIRQAKKDSPAMYILFAILIPLFFIGCFLPCFLANMDALDYAKLERNEFKMDPLLNAKFQKARDKQCQQEVFFNEKEIQWYLNYNAFGYFQAFGTFNRTIHPLFSLFMNFDYKMSRNLRFTFVLGQLSIVTLLTWFSFSKTVIDEPYGEADLPGGRFVWLSLLISLVTLPLPRRLFGCFEAQLYKMKKDKAIGQLTRGDLSREQIIKDRYKNDDGDLEDIYFEDESVIEKDLEHATLVEPYMNFKNLFIALVYLLWLVTVFLSLFITLFVGERVEINISESTKYYIELTEDEALQVVYVWYLSILGWGWLFVNEVRILVISAHAPTLARQIFDSEQKAKELANKVTPGTPGEGKQTPTTTPAESPKGVESAAATDKNRSNWITRLLIPVYSIDTCLDILYLLDIKKNPEVYEPLTLEQPEALFRRAKEVELLSISSKKSSMKGRRGGRKPNTRKSVKFQQEAETSQVVDQRRQAILLGADPGYLSQNSGKESVAGADRQSAGTVTNTAYKKESLEDEEKRKIDQFKSPRNTT